MYISTNGLGLVMSGEQEQIYNQARAALPSCYGSGLEACLDAENGTDFPGCQTILEGYNANEQGMIDTVDALPLCPEPQPCPPCETAQLVQPFTTAEAATLPDRVSTSTSSPWRWLAIGVGSALAFGYFAWGR